MSLSPENQPEYSFSTPLKVRLVAYFRKYYDLDIKDEEADLFLTSLAALYDALSKIPAVPQPEPRVDLSHAGEAGTADRNTIITDLIPNSLNAQNTQITEEISQKGKLDFYEQKKPTNATIRP